MSHKHTKPFNIEHAKDGAPVGARNGYVTVEILKYGKDRIFGTMTTDKEESACWSHDGLYGITNVETVLDLVMLPLGYCEDKPVFVGDVLLDPRMKGDEGFTICAGDYGGLHNCKWPKPKAKYPETRMNANQCFNEFQSAFPPKATLQITGSTTSATDNAARHLANIAIKDAIKDGDVFTRPQVDAVIDTIIDICTRHTNNRNIINAIEGSDWAAVMKAQLK